MTSVARLTSSRDIRAVFAGRITAGSPVVVAHGALRRDAAPSGLTDPLGRDGSPAGGRVAVVAGRRVGRAVDRNRAKRRIRAALASVGVPDGVDVVLTAKPDTNQVAYSDLVDEVRAVLQRLVRRLERT